MSRLQPHLQAATPFAQAAARTHLGCNPTHPLRLQPRISQVPGRVVLDAGPWDEACLSSHGKVRRREVARRNGLGPGGRALLSGGGGDGGGGGDPDGPDGRRGAQLGSRPLAERSEDLAAQVVMRPAALWQPACNPMPSRLHPFGNPACDRLRN